MKLKQKKMENEEIEILTRINNKNKENISSPKLLLNHKMKRISTKNFVLVLVIY